MYCRNCGTELDNSAAFCPKCGIPTVTASSKPIKKKHRRLRPMLIAVAILLIVGIIGTALGGTSADDPVSENSASESSIVQEMIPSSQPESEAAPTPTVETDWLKQYEEQGAYVISVDAEVLFEYGAYYTGYLARTVVTIEQITEVEIKANTDNNSSFFFSMVFDFANTAEIAGYAEGDVVEIVGTIDPPAAIGETVPLSDCHIVSAGPDAEAARQELHASADTQIGYAENYVAQLEAAAAEQAAQDVEAYKASCITVNYSDVERNPRTYEGSDIVFSGSVIQVSEGWFDSVTLRVDNDGDIWYVTYIRADDTESRILENDYITIYGECTGVTSYTSILGSTITIPSVSGKYIDR